MELTLCMPKSAQIQGSALIPGLSSPAEHQDDAQSGPTALVGPQPAVQWGSSLWITYKTPGRLLVDLGGVTPC